jgi:ER membrane protein complex subunit 3
MDILLDQRIRDWVFFPLIFVMFLIGIFRHYLSEYNNNN